MSAQSNTDSCRKVIVTGRPVPKGRPRVYNHHAITPRKTLEAEHWLRDQYIEQNPHSKPFTRQICVDCVFYEPIPKSWSKKKRQLAMDGKLSFMSRPDLDNLVKLVLDALNEVAYLDDSQITGLSAQKIYSGEYENGATIVTIEEIRGEEETEG